MLKIQNSERGQSIVLIALALVALLGFTALAIDGGRVYSDRRHAQNAADAASLAAGGVISLELENNEIYYDDFDCDLQGVNDAIGLGITAAENRAASNGYNTNVTINSDCVDDGAGTFVEKYIVITTHIVRSSQTSFVQIVYNGPLVNRVAATIKLTPRQPLAFGNAVVSLNDNTDCNNMNKNGVVLSGAGETTITGGGVWSNGCLKAVNSSCNIGVINGDIQFAGGSFPADTSEMCDVMSPQAEEASETLPDNAYQVAPPDCGHPDAVTVDSIVLNNVHDEVVLTPNTLYCVTDDGNNAVSVNNGTLIGKGVTIYLVGGGNVSITGGEIDLSAPGSLPDPAPAIPGVLFYVAPDWSDDDASSTLNLLGNGGTKFLGLIYAPDTNVSISGNSEIPATFNTQLVGWNVEISGSAAVDINYNDNWAYSKPTAMDLQH